MINSLGGLGSCNPFKTVFSNNLKNEKSFFGQVLDSVTFVNDSRQEERYGINAEQKQYLKEKYGSLELKIGDKKTLAFMNDLKKMGVITDEEAKCGEYMPVWVASKENTVTSWFNSPNTDDMDIRSSFHIYAILQRGEANKYPELSDFFMKQSSVYEKLDNVMDYIFS